MRKTYLLTAAIGLLTSTFFANASYAQIGKRFPSEKSVMIDTVTGYPITVLTHGPASNAKIYQTHPQWTADGKYIIFRTSSRSPGAQAYAVSETTGEIIQITDGTGNNTSTLNIARKSVKLHFWRTMGMEAAVPGGAPAHPTTVFATGPSTAPTTAPRGPTHLIEVDLAKLFADSEAGAMKPQAEYERVCFTVPTSFSGSGELALDADEKVAYFSVRGGDVGTHLPLGTEIWQKRRTDRMGTGPAGLRSIDLATGEMKVVIDTPFQIGHVQTNPWVPGEIIYCHETGGDAPQLTIWTVNADGSGNRPLYVEAPYDWVTHEAVVTKDEVMFNLIGHQPKLRQHPTGIAVINLRTDGMKILGQVDERVVEEPATRPAAQATTEAATEPATQPDAEDATTKPATGSTTGADRRKVGPGGFWHCNGSADGRWAVGDTFNGNVWLIDRSDGQMTLLTTDHKMKPDHCHPTFDASSTRILIQSGKLSDGKRLDLMVINIPPELLKK